MIYFYLRLYALGWLARNCNQTVVNLTDGLNVCIRTTSLSFTTISYEIKLFFERNKTYSWLESNVQPMQMHDKSSRTLLINLHHCVRYQNLTTFIFCTFTDIRLVRVYNNNNNNIIIKHNVAEIPRFDSKRPLFLCGLMWIWKYITWPQYSEDAGVFTPPWNILITCHTPLGFSLSSWPFPIRQGKGRPFGHYALKDLKFCLHRFGRP